jgi:hypothetical protein
MRPSIHDRIVAVIKFDAQAKLVSISGISITQMISHQLLGHHPIIPSPPSLGPYVVRYNRA